MGQAKWMWNPGDFELYHGMLVNNRRTDGGLYVPPMWRVDAPRRNLFLYKIAVLTAPETITLYANTKEASLTVDGKRYSAGETVSLCEGRHFIKAFAFKDGGFPAVYCVGETFASDETWSHGSYGEGDAPAGTNEHYLSLDDDPEVFKFEYIRIFPVQTELCAGGRLFDFGRERFGKLIFRDVQPADAVFPVICGESREEALDTKQAIVRIQAHAQEGAFTSDSVAFRYVFVPDGALSYTFCADYEYLPLEDRGTFRCEDDRLNRIYDTCVDTLHLNAREAFFDGIKRDRWIWGGDAYQSYFVNYYLTGDRDIVRRTTRMLRGADPVSIHINTIPDYTFYWLIGIWDYYFYTGDLAFVREIYPKMRSIFPVIDSRLDARGLFVGARGDWVFIDWADTAKKGVVCAEQMLLIAAYRAMAKCAALVGEDDADYRMRAEALTTMVNTLFWRDSLGAYVDCIEREDRVDVVTRHANIFALLFEVADPAQKAQILHHVIENPAIPPITTPYFEFFELDAMGRLGKLSYVIEKIRNYWGGMLDLGATTIWEQFDPNEQGVEHYAMYDSPYGRSLCHAWGASPIYLFGRYALGVYPTEPGYRRFFVEPNSMGLDFFEGAVPTPHGTIRVSLSATHICVEADMEGGTLLWNGERYPIEKDVPLTIAR